MEAESVATVHESALVRWIFTESPARDYMVFPHFNAGPQGQIRFEVSGPILALQEGPPGDIDVLLVPRGGPETSVAIEAKRVLVPATAFDTLMPNKLSELKKGARQANGLADRGFHQVYLMVMLATDGRTQTHSNFTGRGPTRHLIRILDDALAGLDLRPQVGVVCVELTQPLDKDFRLAAAFGVRPVRPATRQIQPAALTQAISSLLTP